MASIADVFFSALLDDSKLQVDAQRAGDKAGQTIGSRMSTGLSVKMRAGLGIVAAGSALATKGILELDDAVAEYTADTGASADEAERARKAINAMGGRNIQPIREIGKTLATVRTDMGLTGDAADSTAERFLHFARITKRDAAEEVRSFDDILDAYGKTAADIPGIMDKLVVSHQKYGGAISEDEAALAAMAPQLKAFNLGIDDGIGLLDLFKSSGLDAALVPRALSSAISKLDGRPLKDFLTELSGIEDPGKRAQRAIEVFGIKAGVQLANAIRPGIGSLDAFKISTQEATGATDKAREAIDNTFGNRVQLAIKGVTQRLIDFGSAFGPALTGAASIASLGGALGLGGLLKTVVIKMAQIGTAGGEALVDAAGTATGAAGTIIGNLLANVLDPTNPLLGNPIRKVALKAGALYGATMAGGARVAEFLTGIFVKLPGVAALRGAILAAAISQGGTYGTAMAAAASAEFGAGLAKGIVLPRIGAGAPVDVGEVNKFTDEVVAAFAKHAKEKLPDATKQVFSAVEIQGALVAQRAGERVGGEMGNATIDALIAAGIPEDVARVLAAGSDTVGAGAKTGLEDPANKAVDDMKAHAIAVAQKTPQEMAAALSSGRTEWQDAWDALVNDTEKPLSRLEEIAQIKSRLASKEMRDGLSSQDPTIRARWAALNISLEDRLTELNTNIAVTADTAAKQIAAAIKREKGNTKDQAVLMKIAVADALGTLPSSAYGWGTGIGSGVASGITDTIPDVSGAASNLAAAAYKRLHVSSPAEEGPLSRDGGIEAWGQRLPTLVASGMLKRLRAVQDAASRIAAASIPAMRMPDMGFAAPDTATGLARATAIANQHAAAVPTTAPSSGDLHINVEAHGTPLRPMTPMEIVTATRRAARLGVLAPRRTAFANG